MVATRGGARTGLDDPAEPELNLRKKPVRKAATTTTTKTRTTKAAPPAKTTRAKKIGPEPDMEDEEADELQEHDTAAAPKATRKGRAKKEDVSSTTKPTAASHARATTAIISKPATTRTAKANKVETATPDLKPPTQGKATRATRATASTRATAAKEKAAPLSPKKITQLPKVPARTTRNATVKVTSEKRAVAKGRPATRRKGVSDENAGVPEFRPSTAEKHGEDFQPKKNTKCKLAVSKSTAKPVPEPEAVDIDDDTPMSTRPTTPTDSPQPEHGDTEEHTDVEGANSDLGADLEVSADELCGPKTPMKRLNPHERAQYMSAQKPSLADDVPMKTPARRFKVLGSQGGTPQTQKPYCKPSLPMSEVRPMTVARAGARAMVFPKLQPLVLTREAEETDETANDDTTHTLEDVEVSTVETDRLDTTTSLVQEDRDDDFTPVHITGLPMDKEHDAGSIGQRGDSMIDTGLSSVSGTKIQDRKSVEMRFQMKSPSTATGEIECEDEADVTEEIDPNETIVVEDEDMEDGLDSLVDNSVHSEESVIVRHDMAVNADQTFPSDDSMEDLTLPATTPRAETIKWENLREDVTIPFNFDCELTTSREIASADLDESLGLTCDGDAEVQPGTGVGPVDEPDVLDVGIKMDVETNMTLADTQYQRQSFGDVRLSLDATINLSDFLDISSLADRPGAAPQAHDKTECSGVYAPDEPQVEVGEDNLHNIDVMEATSIKLSATPVATPSTPEREDVPTLPDIPQDEPEHVVEAHAPHYAMPTIAFRRKSLPALIYHTPMKNGARPKTSDGATLPRLANPFFSIDSTQQETTPFRRHLSMAHSGNMYRPQTPFVGTSARPSSRKTPRTSGKASVGHTPLPSQTPRTSSRLNAVPTPKERFPGLPPRETYVELVNTPTSKTPRQAIPSAVKPAMKERFSALPPAEKYEIFTETFRSSHQSLEKVATPQSVHPSTPPADLTNKPVQQEDRYPGLPHRRTYEEHAKTAMPPSRFRTPPQSPAKRPATVQRPGSLRKIALRASTPNGSRTPIKTPLRAPAMTPGQVPLTPHPGAPLKGVHAYVDVFLNDGSSANSTYIAVLHSLGAKTTKTFNERVTHVVYKEGSPATLQRLRLHNKQVADSGKGTSIFCVNGRWVNDSNSEGARMDEVDEAYAVDIEDQRATKRRRKSMEPTSLLNIGGNVVRDTNRKTSLGRTSLGRALKADSPSVESPSMMTSMDIAEKENSSESSFGGDESPATPAYLAAPDSLVQQTAPMNRVRKLDFDAQERAKNRRLTYWDGGEF